MPDDFDFLKGVSLIVPEEHRWARKFIKYCGEQGLPVSYAYLGGRTQPGMASAWGKYASMFCFGFDTKDGLHKVRHVATEAVKASFPPESLLSSVRVNPEMEAGNLEIMGMTDYSVGYRGTLIIRRNEKGISGKDFNYEPPVVKECVSRLVEDGGAPDDEITDFIKRNHFIRPANEENLLRDLIASLLRNEDLKTIYAVKHAASSEDRHQDYCMLDLWLLPYREYDWWNNVPWIEAKVRDITREVSRKFEIARLENQGIWPYWRVASSEQHSYGNRFISYGIPIRSKDVTHSFALKAHKPLMGQ